jgi:DNA-binding transcriptional MerR regulator
VSERLLTIGELAHRTGVARSALRYWEELGLLPPPDRVSGQRRYPEATVVQVGLILLQRDAGFSLAEQKTVAHSRDVASDEWRRLHRRKLAELDDQIANAQAAREAIQHALRCRHEGHLPCPTVHRLVTARLHGEPLKVAHSRIHNSDSTDSGSPDAEPSPRQ